MHELAITQSMVDAVVERVGGAPVLGVRLEIGELSGVVPDAVRFCFDVVTAGTPLEGARLDVDEPAGLVRCRRCDAEFAAHDPIVFCRCGSVDVSFVSGHQLRITSVEIPADTESRPPSEGVREGWTARV